MVPNSLKIELWSRLGALWARAWRQDGLRATPRANFNEKYSILGWPVGSKMEVKSIKNLIKNRLDCCNDFERTFSQSWVGLRVTFSSLLRICEKCDFNNTPMFGGLIFDLKMCIFRLFFLEGDFKVYFF